MLRSLRRIIIAVLLSLPGIALAFFAKPFVLGEGALFLGLALAFIVPIFWLSVSCSPVTPESSRSNAEGSD